MLPKILKENFDLWGVTYRSLGNGKYEVRTVRDEATRVDNIEDLNKYIDIYGYEILALQYVAGNYWSSRVMPVRVNIGYEKAVQFLNGEIYVDEELEKEGYKRKVLLGHKSRKLIEFDINDFEDFDKYEIESLAFKVMAAKNGCTNVENEDDFDVLDLDKCSDCEIAHGNSEVLDAPDYIDCRLEWYSTNVLNRFWSEGGYDFLCESLDEIDPKNIYSVWHYKGKYWYISPSFEKDEIEIVYTEDDDINNEEEWVYDSVDVILYSEDTEVESKLQEKIVATKESLEQESLIELSLFLDLECGELYENYLFVDAFTQDDLLKHPLYLLLSEKGKYDAYDVASMIYDYLENSALVALNNLIDNKYPAVKRAIKRLASKILDKRYRFIEGEIDGGNMAVVEHIATGEQYHIYWQNFFSSSHTLPKMVKNNIEKAVLMLEKRIKEAKEEKLFKEKASKVFVSFDDSIKAGNCKPGTLSFLRKTGIDINKIGGVRGDYLMELAKRKAPEDIRYVKNAVINAIRRQSELP